MRISDCSSDVCSSDLLQSFVATQTAGNVRLAELTDMLSGQLATIGVPESERDGAALAYVGRLLVLKANEVAFHDGFAVLTVAFGVGDRKSTRLNSSH